jgi:signal transduction histidine kinase/ActR/RegA family two-component response regulator
MPTRRVQVWWRELFQGPPLENNVRNALAERFVRWVFGPLWVITLSALAVSFATLRVPEPRQFVQATVVLIGLLYVTHLRRAQRYMRAAGALGATMFVVIATSVLLNSVRAPLYAGGFVLLALVIPLFGNRWGVAAASACLGVGVLRLALEHAGLALPAKDVPDVTRLVLYLGHMAFSLVILGTMQRLLADALSDAHRKTRELEVAHEAEAASEMAFHAVFDQASVGMVLLTSQGAIAQLNQRAALWLGACEDALIGQTIEAASLWTDAQKKLITDAVAAAAEGHNSKHELTVAGDKSAQLVYQISVSLFHTGASNTGRVIVEVVEVSDLVQTRAMLAQARRLEALGKLSGGVAHDINNMLAAILGASELVRSARKSGDVLRMDSGLEMISSAVLRASSLTKQLLAFGRQDRFESVDVDVNRLVTDMGRLFERTLHKNVTVTIVSSEEPAWIRGDVAALENALLNLALNAQDAMPNGGTLTIAIEISRQREATGAPGTSQSALARTVVVRVSDTGSGMSEAVRERLFEPFFTTKAVGKGTGLGLAAVHGTVLNHRGSIAVHSQPGIGTTLELSFPATQAPAVAIRANEVRAAPNPLHARVLLADDEPLVRGTLTAMLQATGCEVRAVNNGEALLEALNAGATPDLIVTDLIMPGLSGKNLVRALESLKPGCPLLLVTGFSAEDVSSALSGRSSHRLLRKPFTRSELLKALNELLPQQLASSAGHAKTA